MGGLNLEGLRFVRFVFADQHGVLRGKTLAVSEVQSALKAGIGFPSSLLLKDTSHRTVFPAFTPGGGVGIADFQGAGDVLMAPDTSTFRALPWAADTGWVLCDLKLQDGRPVPYDTRGILKGALEKLKPHELICGLEVEFHVFKITNDFTQVGHNVRRAIIYDPVVEHYSSSAI